MIKRVEIKNNINLNILKKFMKENNMSITEFCEYAGMTKYTYYKIFSGSAEFGINVIFKLAKAINIELKELFIK